MSNNEGMNPVYNEFKTVTDKEIDIEALIKSLMESDKDNRNLNFKTEISNPIQFAMFDTATDYLESIGFKKSAKLTRDFSKTIKENYVSYKRKGRIEAFSAIGHYLETKLRSVGERLLGTNMR